jgi:hypothetical protein
MNKVILTPGNLIVGDGHDFTAKLQHLVNGKGATHGCTITYPTGAGRDITLALSAEYNGVVHSTWEKFLPDDNYNFWIYEIIDATQEELQYALDYCEKEFLNDKYGWSSWLWFGWAGLWQRVLNPIGRFLHIGFLQHNVLSENNWFTAGTFCTEHTYWFLTKITELHPEKWGKLREILKQYFPNTFQPIQFRDLLQDKNLFRLKMQRVNKITTSF